MKKYQWPWEKQFSSKLFNATAAQLVALANATKEELAKMPASLGAFQPQAVKLAAALAGAKAPSINLPEVPVPVTFSVKDGTIEPRMAFPSIQSLVNEEALRIQSDREQWSADRTEALVQSSNDLSVGEGVLRLLSAFNLLVALAADDELRYRIRRCHHCGRFFTLRRVRSGQNRKFGKRSYCPDRPCYRNWLKTDAEGADASRAKRKRSSAALRAGRQRGLIGRGAL